MDAHGRAASGSPGGISWPGWTRVQDELGWYWALPGHSGEAPQRQPRGTLRATRPEGHRHVHSAAMGSSRHETADRKLAEAGMRRALRSSPAATNEEASRRQSRGQMRAVRPNGPVLGRPTATWDPAAASSGGSAASSEAEAGSDARLTDLESTSCRRKRGKRADLRYARFRAREDAAKSLAEASRAQVSAPQAPGGQALAHGSTGGLTRRHEARARTQAGRGRPTQ